MDKRRPNGLNNPSVNRKNIVKNDYYYNCKKKNLIKRSAITTTVVIMCGTYWYVKEIPIKAEMYINNSVIEWTTEKKNLKGVTFQVLKDGNLIHETKNLKFTDKSQYDTGAPLDINEINTFRNAKSIKILWKAPQDTSSNNTYQVFAINKFGRKIFKTEEVSGGIISGIDKYVIRFNGEEFESTTPVFSINANELKKGKYTIDIKSIDKSGNASEFKTFAFDFNTVNFEFKNGKLIPQDSKYNNEDYNFYILTEDMAESEKEIPQYDKKMFLVNEYIFNILGSGIKPKMTTPSYNIKNNEINFSWKNPVGTSSSHKFYVEAVNKKTLEKSYSDLLKIEGSSEMLGFHYALNNNSSYTVKPSDNYTDNTSISIDSSKLDKNKKYYFHIATIDSTGIISDTKTISLNFKKSNSLEEKKDIVRKFIFKTKNATNDDYREIVNEISNNFTVNDINSLSKSGVKIYLVKENFKDYIKENYNIDADSDSCVINKKSIYYNLNKSTEDLVESIKSILY